MRSNLWSAYNPNQEQVAYNYGPLFYGITTLINPKVAIEIGVCKGYSAIHIAQAIKDCDEDGILVCYDLWEDEDAKSNFAEEQKGKHLTSTRQAFEKTIEDHGLRNTVKVYTREAFDVLHNYQNEGVDLIHLDIGNCGDVLLKILPEVLRTLRVGGYFLFEGGAPWRDKVSWMIEHNKRPIADFLCNHQVQDKFEIITFYEACSMTVCRRKK